MLKYHKFFFFKWLCENAQFSNKLCTPRGLIKDLNDLNGLNGLNDASGVWANSRLAFSRVVPVHLASFRSLSSFMSLEHIIKDLEETLAT